MTRTRLFERIDDVEALSDTQLTQLGENIVHAMDQNELSSNTDDFHWGTVRLQFVGILHKVPPSQIVRTLDRDEDRTTLQTLVAMVKAERSDLSLTITV